jgi:nitroreductase
MRKTDYKNLHNMFIERWSPRAFLPDPIADEDIKTLFEAARWSPSCFNEQPWRFVYAHQPLDLQKFRSVLVESNQIWAGKAPLLVLAFSKKSFTQNGKPNRWADFDTGAAWMALSLQANKLGLHTHGMGGFDPGKAFAVTGMDSEEFNAICAIAIGKRGDANTLPGNLKAGETPGDRMSLNEIIFDGSATLQPPAFRF